MKEYFYLLNVVEVGKYPNTYTNSGVITAKNGKEAYKLALDKQSDFEKLYCNTKLIDLKKL